MNNKAHLRPKDFDSNGDIIPMACKEVKGDLISREAYIRPQGEWIFGSTLGHGWMKCSNCCVSQSEKTLCWSYCPNCGAKMKGGAE